jgi:hypothetical protein
MHRFLISLLIFFIFIIGFIITFGILFHYSDTKSDYFDSIIDKHKFLEINHSPRVIFCGGSNLSFGLDSKKIHDSIGFPVINLALSKHLGLEYILNEIKLVSKPTDIIIFSLEYYMDLKGDYLTQKYTSKNFPTAKKYFKRSYYKDVDIFIKEELRILKINISQFLIKTGDVKLDTNSIYSRSSFNEYGDLVRHLNKPLPIIIQERSKLSYRKWNGISLLNDFAKYADSNNIKLYFLFPPYPETEFLVNKEVILKYAEDLTGELKIPILNKPTDSVFPDSLFYDTINHLNKRGRDKRTNLIIDILQVQFKQDSYNRQAFFTIN